MLSPKTWFQVKRFRLGLDSIVNYIENESLNSFERELIQHLKAKKTYFTLMYLRYLSFQNFFINSKIESIILSDENSPQQKVIQYAARKTAVKVFAIQHGAIYNNHFGYTYGKYIHPPILPDVTFTWGEFYNEVLLKHGGYQAEQVKAVGSLRKSRTSTSGSTPKDNKSRVVLFATQPIPNETLRLQYLKDVFHCFLAVEAEYNYQLIIRPHPNEKDDQYFVNVATEVGFSNYSIERNVAMEDYLKEDIAGYVKEGVGIPVHNGNELMEVFERHVIDVDHQKYNKFISRFFHSADEKAADRILKILTDK